jgi:hypothetical protein
LPTKKKLNNNCLKIVLFGFLMLVPFSLFAQLYLFQQKTLNSNYQSRFKKQITYWTWNTRFTDRHRTTHGWSWDFSEELSSSLLVPSQSQKLWKDEHRFNGDIFYTHHQFQYGVYLNSWLHHNEQISDKSKFANHSIGIFNSGVYFKALSLSPYVGFQQLQTRSKIDNGWDLGVNLKLQNFDMDHYRMNVDAESNYDLYKKLQNFDNRIDVKLSAIFSERASDSLALHFSEMSRDHYNSDFSEINQVVIYQRIAENKLFYNLSNQHLLTFATLLRSKQLYYITNRNVSFFQNQLRYLYFRDNLSMGFNLRTNEEVQDNTRISTDSETKETALGFNLDYLISAKNAINLNLSFTKLQYDTPEENLDDRDEQRIILNLKYLYKLNRYLNMEWNLYAYQFHQVYINASHSHNNRLNRIIKLVPKVNYSSEKISNSFLTQVLANYTSYDFEREDLPVRSFVFRRYVISDSLNYKLWRKVSTGFYVKAELEDRGTFFKDQFAQMLSQSNTSYYYVVYLQSSTFFDVRIGYSFYSRVQWRHIPFKFQEREINNFGPYIHLYWSAKQGAFFSGRLSYQTLDDSIRKPTYYYSGSLRLNYFF